MITISSMKYKSISVENEKKQDAANSKSKIFLNSFIELVEFYRLIWDKNLKKYVFFHRKKKHSSFQ